MLMLNAKQIHTEAELQQLLVQCDFASDSPTVAPSWQFWQREWRRHTLPIARYLLDVPNVEFFIAINDGAFQVYEQDQQNFWFHLVGEVVGDVSAEELAARLGIMTQSTDVLERRLALRLRQGIE
jgi:hypothetical protein